jgi:hypothetical protein
MGNKIIEGILSASAKKFEKYVKNFKHVASFSYLIKGNDGKPELGWCKIPVRLFKLFFLILSLVEVKI